MFTHMTIVPLFYLGRPWSPYFIGALYILMSTNLVSFTIMSVDPTSNTRPAKRRKTKGVRRLAEDDDEAADGIAIRSYFHDTETGQIEERQEIPIWSDRPAAPHIPEQAPQMDQGYEFTSFDHQSPRPESPNPHPRTQNHYLEEFVDRVHPMLKALLTRDACPRTTKCRLCQNNGRWRCRDCTMSGVLCRGCIRKSHSGNPLHRIEVWTGSHFHRAELWEVGVYMVIPHHERQGYCDKLQLHDRILSNFQDQRDAAEQLMLSNEDTSHPGSWRSTRGPNNYRKNLFGEACLNKPNAEMEEEDETGTDDMLDKIYIEKYKGMNAPADMSSDNREYDEDEEENDDAIPIVPHGYLPPQLLRSEEITPVPTAENTRTPADSRSADKTPADKTPTDIPPADKTPTDIPPTDIPPADIPPADKTPTDIPPTDIPPADIPPTDIPPADIPQTDALNNPFIRIVHNNGIHHMALISCTCHGREATHGDLMAAGLVPTSFKRYRTMFTHAVLDDFRLSNLECKASAYQYFQKLRRETSPMSPDSVPNLYHELRRMSRIWRWMKKLKWAGVPYRPEPLDVKPGELANFCPACPQPGINLPADWPDDPER
jgi:hypothetical protein